MGKKITLTSSGKVPIGKCDIESLGARNVALHDDASLAAALSRLMSTTSIQGQVNHLR